MAVRFKKSLREIKILDHTQGFNEKLLNFEFRFDPLTRRRARIMNLKFKVPVPPDVEKTVKKSLEYPCPFCGENGLVLTQKIKKLIVKESG